MYLCWWRTCGADSRRDHERARLLAADRDGGAGASVEASDGGVVVVSRVRSTVPRKVAGSISARQVTMHVPGSASPGPARGQQLHGGTAGPGSEPGRDIMNRGSVFRRCGCRHQGTGRLLGARCPGLRSSRHRSWYFSADVPSAAGERRRVRRGVRLPHGGHGSAGGAD
jgi:hypothetical protein